MIEIKIDDKQIQEKLKKVKDIKLVLRKIAEFVKGFTIRLFNEQKDPYGKAWKPLAFNTKRKASSKILIDTGLLRSSIKSEVINDNTIRLGSYVIYAPTHQFGAKITAKRRKFLTIPITTESRYISLENIKARYYSTFIRKNVIFGQKTKGSKPIALFILKREVEIPARPFLPYKELPESWKEFILKQLEKHIRE